MRCGMRPRPRRGDDDDHRQPAGSPAGRPRPARPAPGQLHARRPEVGRGLVPGPVRRHPGAVRGDHRGPRPAAPPRQGHGLGHRGVLDAAARHGRADRARVRRRAASAAGRTRSSGSSGARCAASSTCTARRADGHRRLRRAPGRRRHAHRVDHRRLRRARGGAHHLRDGAPPRRARSRPSPSASSTASPSSTSTTARTRAPRSTSTSSAPTPGHTSSSRGRPRASRSTGPRPDGLLDLADAGLARCSRPRPRSSRPSGGDRIGRPGGLGCSSRPARPTSCASCASCSACDRRRARLARRPAGSTASRSRTARRSRPTPPIKARFGVRASGLPTLADDSGLEVDALDGGPGVRTRRYAGEDATDADNNAKLLAALDGLPPERRGARYVCVLALALPDAAGPRGGLAVTLARGTCRGRIATAPRGDRRLRLRPDLRAGLASRPAAGRSGSWTAGREARDLAPGARRAADDAATSRAHGF